MNYKEFKAELTAKREAAAAKATPQVMAKVAPSEARQRIDAKIASFRAKFAEKAKK